MTLGFAVINAHRAHAVASGGDVNRRLFRELNDLGGPPLEWYDRQKLTTDGPAFGLIPGHHAPDPEHGGQRFPYQAEVDELPGLLARGWTPDDPAILDKLGLRVDAQGTPTRT